MVGPFENFVAMGICCFFEIGLKNVREFSQIMPEAGEVAPLLGGFALRAFGEHVGGELGGEVSDFVEVPVVLVQGFAMRAGLGVSS